MLQREVEKKYPKYQQCTMTLTRLLLCVSFGRPGREPKVFLSLRGI
jgi:hypothetical protein